METIKTHIGIFDFWSVFGVGVVIVTSYCVVYYPQVFTSPPENISVWLFVPLSYTVGLVLFCVSSIIADIPWLRYNSDNVTQGKEKHGLIGSIYYHKYFCYKSKRKSTTQSKEKPHVQAKHNISKFKNKYDNLKIKGLSPRVDKLHSIYSMTRGIALGYLCLTGFSTFVSYKYVLALIFFLLTFAFFVMSKKYLYRWMEWVFQESKA